jgi:putative FmdB family regulatory protein
MPTYEYRCPDGHSFELFQRMSDPRPDACEVCGAAPVERVLSAPAVHFKGSGFYSTDYARGRSDGKGPSEAKKDADQAKSGEEKSDGKSSSAEKTKAGSSGD